MKQIKFAYFAMSESISVTRRGLIWFGLFVFKLFYFTILLFLLYFIYYYYYYDSFMEEN